MGYTYGGGVYMPMSEKKRLSNKKWNDANLKVRYDRIQLVVNKGKRDIIKAHADGKGMTVNEYVRKLISDDMGGLDL